MRFIIEGNLVLGCGLVAFYQNRYHLWFDLHAKFWCLVVGWRLNLHVLSCCERCLLRQLCFNDVLRISWIRRLLMCLSHDSEVAELSLFRKVTLVFSWEADGPWLYFDWWELWSVQRVLLAATFFNVCNKWSISWTISVWIVGLEYWCPKVRVKFFFGLWYCCWYNFYIQ